MRSTIRLLAALLPATLLAREPMPPPAMPELVIREVRYDATLSDKEARFAVELDAESLGKGEAAAPLFEGDVAVLPPDPKTSKLPADTRLARAGNQYRLVMAKPGRVKLKLDLVAKITRAEPWNSVTFTGPVAAIAAIAAQIPGDGVELQLLSGTATEPQAKGGPAKVRGVLGADRTVSLRWQTKAAEAARKALVTCETSTGIQITPTVVKLTTRLRYDIVQGNVPKLTLTLPAAQALTRLQGDQIRDWQIKTEGDRQLLTIEPIKPLEKTYSLTLFTEQPVETTPAALALAPPQPQDVARETGTLSLSAEDMLVETDAATGLRQVNAPGGALAAYEFYGRPATLALKLRRIEPVVNAATRVTARLEESRLLVTHALTLNVEKAGVYAVELAPLGNFLVSDVRGDGIEDWKAAAGKLVVNFAGRVLGQRAIEVQLEQAQKTVPEQLALAPLRVAGATKETAQIGVAAAPGFRLKTAKVAGLREVPVAAISDFRSEISNLSLAYTAEQADWQLTLAVERLAPRLLADIFNLVTIGDGLVGGSATVRYAILNQGVQEFRLRLPSHWKNVEFTAPGIRRKDQQKDDKGELWTLALQDKVWGSFTLVITYDEQFDPHKAVLAAGGVHALDIERETGTVAITSAANLQLKEKTASEPLRRVDESELAENDRALISRPVLLAYRYAAGEPYTLAVEVMRFEEQAVLQAVTDRTQLTTVLTDAGQMLTQASFMVKNNAKQFQRFMLPKGAEFWSCFVAGQAAKPERDGDALLVPLPRGVDRDQAFPVDIVYAQKTGDLKSWTPRSVALEAPRTDVQTTYAEWELFVPKTHTLAGFGGNMTVARGTTYGLRDAWETALAFWRQLLHSPGVLIATGVFALALVVAFLFRSRRSLWIVLSLGVVVLMVCAVFDVLRFSIWPGQSPHARVARAVISYADDHNGRPPATLEEMVPRYLSKESLKEYADSTVLADPTRMPMFVEEHGSSLSRFLEPGAKREFKGIERERHWPESAAELETAKPARPRPMEDSRSRRVAGRDAAGRGVATAAVPAAPPPLMAPAPAGGAGAATPESLAASVAGVETAAPTVAGIRPIRVDIPREGDRFAFTKVLNVHGEPLSAKAWALKTDVRNVALGTVELIAFLIGALMVRRQWRRERASSLWLTIGLALVIASVGALLIVLRLLHVVFIAAVPVLSVMLLVWLAKRYIPRKTPPAPPMPPAPPSPPMMPPSVPPAVTALLALALSVTLAGAQEAQQAVQHSNTPILQSPIPASPRATITSATYTGDIREKLALFEAVLELAASDVGQRVALFGGDVAVQEFSATAKDARLVRDGGWLSVTLPKRGAATVRVKFVAKVTGDAASRKIGFAVPPALTSKLVAKLADADAAVELPAAVSLKTEAGQEQTRVEAVLGAATRVEMSWTPRMKRAAEVAATVFCQNTTLASFGGGVLNMRATLSLQVAQGELRQARVRLPAGQRLLKVEGELVRNWDLKDEAGAQVLTVELLKGISSTNWPLTVVTEKVLGKLPATERVETPRLLDAKRETGWVAIAGSEELSVTVEKAGELQRVDTEEFLKAEAKRWKLDDEFAKALEVRKGGEYFGRKLQRLEDKAASPPIVAAYRFQKPEFELAARVEAVQPQIEATVRNEISVTAEQITVSAKVDYVIKKTGVFALRLALPAGYRIESVTGGNLPQWVERTEAGARLLEVTLKDRTLGAYALNVQLVQPLREVPKSLEIAGVHPLGAQKLSGTVSVTAEPGIQLKAATVTGLTEIPAATTGGGLAYKFIVSEPAKTAPWELRVATETVEPWVRAEVVNWVTLTETLVTGRSLVRYDIQNAPVKELRVKVPAAFKNVELNGADIRRRDQNGEEWRVELQNKTRGYYYLVVSWELPCAPAKTGLELAGVEALGVERESGGIAISARPPLQVEGVPVGSDLLPIDASELPDLTSRPTPDRAVVMSARKTEMEAKLDNIVIPKLEFREASIVDVINFLTDQSREIDTQKTGGSGVNIVLGGGVGAIGGPQAPGVTLNLHNVPLRDALRYVTDIAGLKFRVEEKAVIVVPCSYMPPGSMQTRSYKVIRAALAPILGDVSSDEVKKFFVDAGVPFPTGASVTYQDQINMMFVTNTPENLEVFEQVLASLNIPSGRAQTNAPSARVDDSVVLAYRYLRPGWKLKLTAKRFKEAEVLQALVDSARLTTVVAEDGQTMTMLTLAVRNNGRQYLEVTLPPGAQVWSSFVGGQAVRPTKREGKLLLPLERSAGGDAPVNVELTYVSAEKFPAASGRFEMATPAVDVPLKNARWEMYLPPNYRVSDFEGTMAHEDIVSPLVQVFSLTEYERVENVQQQMREAEVSSFLSSARSNISAGKAKVAMDNYNRALANAGQGASFARNAADLKDIGEQLRRSQAMNVQNNEAQVSFFGYGGMTKSGAGTVQLGIQPAQQPVPQQAAPMDTDAAAKQYDKLQQAQELAVARVLPLRVNLPTHGAKHAFTQVLQTEIGKPMTVRFHATNTRATTWLATAGMGATAFVVLWIITAVALGRRR